MARVFWWHNGAAADNNAVDSHVQRYALFNTVMNFVESFTWIFGILLCPYGYRWIVFIVGAMLGQRIPRAFMANDFHGKLTRSSLNGAIQLNSA